MSWLVKRFLTQKQNTRGAPGKPIAMKKTKIRMVFDATLNDTGPSLYNCLYLDPFLCECLVGLWLCFHINNIAFISDIEKIFLQILLHNNNKDLLDFFDLKMLKNLNVANCRPYGRQKLLSACVSIWTESHKICQTWVAFVLTDYG